MEIPKHSSLSVLATENQRVIDKIKEEIPKFHKSLFGKNLLTTVVFWYQEQAAMPSEKFSN